MPKQPQLFETSQTETILHQLQSYQELTDRQGEIVRAYIEAHEDHGGRITKDDWRKKAKEIGVSKTRFYEILNEAPQAIWATISEALQYVGENAAQYGALALYAAGLRLYEQIAAGERATKDLTSVELGIMKECVQSLNPARLMAFSVQDNQGNTTQGAVAGRAKNGDVGAIADQAATVASALRAELGPGGGADGTGGEAESEDGAGSPSESVQVASSPEAGGSAQRTSEQAANDQARQNTENEVAVPDEGGAEAVSPPVPGEEGSEGAAVEQESSENTEVSE